MSKPLKWVIVILAMAAVTYLIYLSGELFGKTLGALPTFIIWAAISLLGLRWTRNPENKRVDDERDDSSES